MLSIHPSTRVFLCSEVIDMRFSHDALSGLVTTHFGVSALSGHIFVFFSRRRDRMKLLFWETDGFALYSNVLSEAPLVGFKIRPR